MSEIFVDTEKLEERYRKGSSVREMIMGDLERLKKDAADLCSSLRGEGDSSLAEKILTDVEEITRVTGSMTDVCEFDRYAIVQYEKLIRKIEDTVKAAEV